MWESRSLPLPRSTVGSVVLPARGMLGAVVRGAEASPAGLSQAAAGSARSAGCPAGTHRRGPAGACPPRPGGRGRPGRGGPAAVLPSAIRGGPRAAAAPPGWGRLPAAAARAQPRRAEGWRPRGLKEAKAAPGDVPSGVVMATEEQTVDPPRGLACLSVRGLSVWGLSVCSGPVCPSLARPVRLCSYLPVSHPLHVGAAGCGESFPREQVIKISE